MLTWTSCVASFRWDPPLGGGEGRARCEAAKRSPPASRRTQTTSEALKVASAALEKQQIANEELTKTVRELQATVVPTIKVEVPR
jgi:hypothetical protein